jgi:CheY-like chemotaxis protein
MSDNGTDVIDELRRTAQSLASVVGILRQPEPDACAVSFLCSSAQRRLEDLIGELETRRAGRRVLIADGEREWTELLARALRAQGCEVRTAANPEEAVTACRELKPEVMLVDTGMTGHDAARRLRAARRSAVMVAVTRWGRDSDRQKAEHAGFDHFVAKPVLPAALAELVATFPGQKRTPSPATAAQSAVS